MKKIEIITRTEKLEIIKKILVNHNCLGLTVYSVMGCGRQKGHISKAEMMMLQLIFSLRYML